MAGKRPRSLRSPLDRGLLSRRLAVVAIVAVAVVAIGLPATRVGLLYLERRELVVQRILREAEVQILRAELLELAPDSSLTGN
jgi:hypothetical protein